MEDMTTFLAIYTASLPTVGSSIQQMFSNAASKVFSDAKKNSKRLNYPQNYFYDKLIVDCVYQMPLLDHSPNLLEGCNDFLPILTSNGLCYSFNGMETGQAWLDSKIIQSFRNIFGTFGYHTRTFRGVGQSEGMKS